MEEINKDLGEVTINESNRNNAEKKEKKKKKRKSVGKGDLDTLHSSVSSPT